MTSTAVTKRPTHGIPERRIKKYGSQLAQSGKLEDASTNADWLARANGLFLARQHNASALKVPKTLGDAIAADGTIHEHAEVYVFGKWLLLDGAPGLSERPGKKPNYQTVIETLACAIHVAAGLGSRIRGNGRTAKRRPEEPTKTNLAKKMPLIFGKTVPTSHFDNRLKVLTHVLSDYQRHLESRMYEVAGKPATTSHRVRNVLSGAMLEFG